MASDIKLFNMDCMEALREMEDNQFDLAIVDPPYGIGVDKMTMFDGAKVQKRHKEYADIKPDAEYFQQLERVSKNQIIWGGNYFGLKPTRCPLIWDKMQEFSGATFEMAWSNFDKPAKAFRMSRVQAYAKGTIHPTQKPVELYKWLLNNYAKEGDKILDTHFGSLSIGVACWDLGFDLTAYELDEDYFKAGFQRLETHKEQGQFNFA